VVQPAVVTSAPSAAAARSLEWIFIWQFPFIVGE
jgi:hypothetical protein